MSQSRCIYGPTYLVWSSSARLSGIGLWGRPERQHATCLIRAIGRDLDYRQHLSLIDTRRIESIDPVAFDLLANFVGVRSEKLRRRISAQALLRSDGLVGTVVAGFYQVLDHAYPVEVFKNPCDALDWLGASNQAAVVGEIDGILDRCAGSCAIVQALRAYLRRNPGKASLPTAAAALGMSARRLQHKLQVASTSFQVEQNTAQINLAKRLLCDTTYDIKRIAFEVGCSSAASFSVLFRKLVGQSPSAWRTADVERHPATRPCDGDAVVPGGPVRPTGGCPTDVRGACSRSPTVYFAGIKSP